MDRLLSWSITLVSLCLVITGVAMAWSLASSGALAWAIAAGLGMLCLAIVAVAAGDRLRG